MCVYSNWISLYTHTTFRVSSKKFKRFLGRVKRPLETKFLAYSCVVVTTDLWLVPLPATNEAKQNAEERHNRIVALILPWLSTPTRINSAVVRTLPLSFSTRSAHFQAAPVLVDTRYNGRICSTCISLFKLSHTTRFHCHVSFCTFVVLSLNWISDSPTLLITHKCVCAMRLIVCVPGPVLVPLFKILGRYVLSVP